MKSILVKDCVVGDEFTIYPKSRNIRMLLCNNKIVLVLMLINNNIYISNWTHELSLKVFEHLRIK